MPNILPKIKMNRERKTTVIGKYRPPPKSL
jgi:hypothetical protein